MIAPGQHFPVQEAGGTAAAPISADFTDTTQGTPTADDQIVADESPDVVNPNFST